MAMNIDLGGFPPGSSDETFETVQWVIVDVSAPTTPVAQGQINVAQAGSTASFVKFGLPPGGYGVLLTATSVSGATTCEGQGAIFSVFADQETPGSILLNCSSERELGALRINGEFNRCAIVKSATVSPAVVSVGGFIDVTAQAQDDEGDAVVYEWRALSGTFTDPAAATTQYRCEAIGTHDITIAVSDDEDQAAHNNFPPTPAPAFTYCEDTWTTTVECVSAPTCPNGVLDPGEDCDVGPPPVGPSWFTCDPASCLRVPTCGDGIVDAGEACDPCDDAGGCDPGAAGYNGGMPTTDPFCSSCQA
ncbi:MAG: hypothetical protein JRH14_16075, partial [Deltaproteobacteria bacterium]|nr:hypothetical protein [Deltaproteobacteria bacterium]